MKVSNTIENFPVKFQRYEGLVISMYGGITVFGQVLLPETIQISSRNVDRSKGCWESLPLPPNLETDKQSYLSLIIAIITETILFAKATQQALKQLYIYKPSLIVRTP